MGGESARASGQDWRAAGRTQEADPSDPSTGRAGWAMVVEGEATVGAACTALRSQHLGAIPGPASG